MGSYDVIFVMGFYYLYFKELRMHGLGIGFHHGIEGVSGAKD